MSNPISSTIATAASQAAAAAPKASLSGLADLTKDVLLGDELKEKLGKAIDDLANPDPASVLSAQAMTAELSFLSAAVSSTVQSLAESVKGVAANMD